MNGLRVVAFAILCGLGGGASLGGSTSVSNESNSGFSRPAVLNEFVASHGLEAGTVVFTMRSNAREAILDGRFIVYRNDGTKEASGTYRNGKLHGELSFWHPNGRISVLQVHEEGKLEGSETCWRENGAKLRTTEWKADQKHGLEIYWDKNGKVVLKIHWELGRPASIELYEGGHLTKRLAGTNALDYFRQKAIKKPGHVEGVKP